MPRLSVQQIEEAVVQGIECAQKKYLNWALLTLSSAPEYFITMNVAEQIMALDGAKYLTLEYNAKYTLEDAGAMKRGRLPKDLRADGRVDIVLWYGKDEPRAIIEIKKFAYDSKQNEKDFLRIKKMLQYNPINSSLQFGIFAYYDEAEDGIRKTAHQTLEGKDKRIRLEIKKYFGDEFIVSSSFQIIPEKDYSWSTGCFLIRPKPNR